MREIKRISLIGLGGIGASYASKLHDMDAGCLSVITDEARCHRYQTEGFVVNGKQYNFNYIVPGEQVEPADLIIMSVKFHHLSQAILDIRQQVGPDTIILSLLNGISSEKIIGEVYGMEKLLYGMVLGIDAERQGNSVTYASTAKIYFGEENNTTTSNKVAAVRQVLDKAGIAYIVPENMLRTLWWKFMFNVGINQTSAVLRAPYKVFQEIREAEDFFRSAMQEVVLLSQRVGIDLTEQDMEHFVSLVKRQSPEAKTSMLQDVEAGRKTEVEMLAGTVCELGRQHGVETPVNRMLFNMIRTMEQVYMST